MVHLEYREVDVKELKELEKLTTEIWHEYFASIISVEQIDYMVDKFQSEWSMREQIEKDNYTYFYVICENEKAGYIGLSRQKDYLFLSKFYIKKEFRHRGIGTQTFEFIKDFAGKNNYNIIHLTVNKYNQPAIDAYKKWGFKVTDAVVTDIGDGFVRDDYLMDYGL